MEIKESSVYINDIKIPDPRIAKNHYANAGNFAKANQKIHIPAASYFLMGDNSINSLDSRFYGLVPLKDIKGKVIKIFAPLERAGRIE